MKYVRWTYPFFAVLTCFLLFGCATNENGQGDSYGPLTFNKAGADFYFSQNGEFSRAEVKDGVIEIQLNSAPFQLGYNGRQLNLALAEKPITEISTAPDGSTASRLSGALTGAKQFADELIVYSGNEWSDGNTEFGDHMTTAVTPMNGFQYGYQVNRISVVSNEQATLGTFKGTVYGFIVVYKQSLRMNRDIMPVRITFN